MVEREVFFAQFEKGGVVIVCAAAAARMERAKAGS